MFNSNTGLEHNGWVRTVQARSAIVTQSLPYALQALCGPAWPGAARAPKRVAYSPEALKNVANPGA